MSTQLFKNDDHVCIALTDHACGGFGLQATRFLVLDGAASALIVSGYSLGFDDLRHSISPFINPDDLELIICTRPIDEQAAHFHPWLKRTCVTFVGIKSAPNSLGRPNASLQHGRFTFLPNAGGRIALCEHALVALPAPADEGVRKLRVFDPFSKLLFDCDGGAQHLNAASLQCFASNTQSSTPWMPSRSMKIST